VPPEITNFESDWIIKDEWMFHGWVDPKGNPVVEIEVRGFASISLIPDSKGYFEFSLKIPPNEDCKLYVKAQAEGGLDEIIYTVRT